MASPSPSPWRDAVEASVSLGARPRPLFTSWGTGRRPAEHGRTSAAADSPRARGARTPSAPSRPGPRASRAACVCTPVVVRAPPATETPTVHRPAASEQWSDARGATDGANEMMTNTKEEHNSAKKPLLDCGGDEPPTIHARRVHRCARCPSFKKKAPLPRSARIADETEDARQGQRAGTERTK